MNIVVKIGGSLFNENLELLYKDIKALVDAGHRVIVVHGGGPQINDILKGAGKDPRYIVSASGMKSRHTDESTRDAAIMALGGLVNKGIVSGLFKQGIRAFGFTGVDGAMLRATRKDKIVAIDPVTSKRYVVRNDFSGKIDPDKVDDTAIRVILDAGFVPVIGALAIDDAGSILNTDGDRAAASVCKALNGDVLVSVTDVLGVLKDMGSKQTIPTIPAANLDAMMAQVDGGMRKKIFAVKEALTLGVASCIITSGLVDGGISRALKGEIGTIIKA